MFFSNLPNSLRSRLREALTISTTRLNNDLRGAVWLKTKTCLRSFFYPAFCLHCREKLPHPQLLICQHCVKTIEWFDESPCCCYCGCRLQGNQCPTCVLKKTFLRPHVSLFSLFGPIADSWNFFCKGQDDSMAKLWACLVTVKLAQLPWPLPTLIVPIPGSKIETWRQRYQKSVLIAKALGRIFALPVCCALIRTSTGKLALKKNKKNFCDQRVLLITAELLTSDSVAAARHCLRGLFPVAIYSLAVIDRRTEDQNMGESTRSRT